MPDAVAEAERRLGVRCGAELPGGILSFVCEARTHAGSPVVLELAGPWDRPGDEAPTLRAWDGSGAPRLLDEVAELGARGRRERQVALATALGVEADRVRRWGVVVATHR